jgi:membrane protein
MNAMKSLRDGASRFSQSLYMTLTIFFKKETQNHASGMALYFFLSAIPLVYLLNTIIAGNLDLSKALYFMLGMLHLNFMDVDFSNSSDNYYGLFKVTSWVSIVVLLWSTRGLMRSVQGAFAVIFSAPRNRRFIIVNTISLLIIPFSFLVLGLWSVGDYLTIHLDYAAIGIPALGHLLKPCFVLIGRLMPFLLTWSVAFLAFYLIPPKRPGFRLAIATSFACALLIAVFQFFTNTVFKVDQYIRIYGSLGAIIFALIWAYIVSLIFLLCAEFLRVSGKIDVIAMERIFLGSEGRGPLAARIEHALFKRSKRLMEKYGRFCHKDAIVIRQHSISSSIYFLYSGKVGIYKNERQGLVRIGEVNEGELFGEVDHLLGRPVNATFVAEAESFLFELTPEIFEGLMDSNLNLSRQVIGSLCRAFPR